MFTSDNFGEAQQFRARRRRFPPAVYYEQRLFEEPMPKLPDVSTQLPITQQNVDNFSAVQEISNAATALGTVLQAKLQARLQATNDFVPRSPISIATCSQIVETNINQDQEVTLSVSQTNEIDNIPSLRNRTEDSPTVLNDDETSDVTISQITDLTIIRPINQHQIPEEDNSAEESVNSGVDYRQIDAFNSTPDLPAVLNPTEEQLPLSEARSEAGQGIKNPSKSPSKNRVKSESKEARPVYGFFEINANEILSLIQKEQTYTIDDIEMSFIRFPKPFLEPIESTHGKLMKRENDIISGNIPFDTNVRIDDTSKF